MPQPCQRAAQIRPTALEEPIPQHISRVVITEIQLSQDIQCTPCILWSGRLFPLPPVPTAQPQSPIKQYLPALLNIFWLVPTH